MGLKLIEVKLGLMEKVNLLCDKQQYDCLLGNCLGYWARNILTKMAVRNVTFSEDEQHMRETYYRLERYDEHEEYDIRPGYV